MKKSVLGFICGLLNGLFGAGGGVAAVPLLESTGLPPRKSHATSVALIFVLSLITTISYFLADKIDFELSMQFIPYGIIGAFIGSFLLKKLENDLLRRIFGIIILISAFNMFLK